MPFSLIDLPKPGNTSYHHHNHPTAGYYFWQLDYAVRGRSETFGLLV